MRRDPGAAFARALAFENSLRDRLSKEREKFPWGTAFFNPRLPAIYDANFLKVERFEPEVGAGELVAEADRLMAPRGLRHRKIATDDEDAGERLLPQFEEIGWVAERLLFMIHVREPERSSDIPVDEIAPEVHARAKDEFNRRDPYFQSEDEIEQMRDMARLHYEITDKRGFAAYVDGSIASVCELYSDGVTAQIEDVATLKEHRGRGLATAVVLRALHEAQNMGHETIFLVADDRDWPKEMYAKLGFEGAGRTYHFLLRPQQPPNAKNG